jgi:NitT/TauT family transport system substrate-binding protein
MHGSFGSRRLALLGVAAGAVALGSSLAHAEQINVSLPNNSTCTIAAPHIAEQMGIYEDTDVQVSYVSAQGAVPAVAFLANGGADLVTLDPNEVYAMATAGQQGSLIYELMQQEAANIAVSADSDITSLEDLKGKTIGLAGDRDSATTAIALFTVGLTLEDVSTVVTGDSGPVVARALRDNQVQAFVGGPEDMAAIDANGIPLRYITPLLVSQSIGNSFVIWDDTIEAKRDVVTKFLRGVAMANLATQIDPKATASMCAQVVPEEWEDPSVGWAIFNNSIRNLNLKRTKQWGEVQPDVWADYQKPLIELGSHPAFIDPSEFLDVSFIEGANDFTTAEVKERIKAWREANPDKLLP